MDIVRWLQARGAASNSRALTDAAARGEVATVGYLLAQNPGPEAVNDALRFAVLFIIALFRRDRFFGRR
jgi:hypothetical protein